MSWRFVNDVQNEVAVAKRIHAPIHSLHEGYAVILEELDEFWEEVRKKPDERDEDRVYDELVQLAAMAMRTADDCGLTHEIDMQVRAEQAAMDGYPPEVE